ncbi:MAG TPA: hypothetical protein VIF62_29795 [Labilithrix sp.]
MRSYLFFFLCLTACTSPRDDATESSSSSDLTTSVLASNAAALAVGPNGELRLTGSDTKVSIVDPATGALTPAATPNPLFPGYTHGEPIGWDATHFYFYAQISDDFYGGRRIYRAALDPAAKPEALADVGNGENAPDPLATAIGDGGAVYWTTYPNTCSLGSSDSCWQMVLGRASADGAAQRAKPALADGTYVGLGPLSFYDGDLYAANSTGVFKVPGGDVTKPVESVCTFPSTFKTKLTNSTILAGTSRATFAASAKGFLVPLQSPDYASALGLVRWDCSTQTLTPFGAPAQGEARTFGLTQIADIVVRGNDVFWLNRQAYSSANEYADSYYALEKTSL